MNILHEPLILTSILFCLAIIISAFWNLALERRIKKLLGNTNAKNLEEAIHNHISRAEHIEQFCESLDEKASLALERFDRSIQGVGMVRYNPYGEVGVKQSFSLALIDGKKNGVILSTLYVRDNMRVFAKDVENGILMKEGSEEEIAALGKALERLV